jgi:chromate reductase
MGDDPSIKILGFAGSARKGSFNKMLVRAALAGSEAVGAETTFVDLRDYPMPLYDGDHEAAEGLPNNAKRLQEIFREHDGFLLATPEYNGCISPLLKNTIDWMTRSPEAHPDLSAFQGKYAALLAASPGPLGGMRSIGVVRELLNNLGVTVLANPITLRAAHEQFSQTGELVDDSYKKRVPRLGENLARILMAIKKE